MDWHKVLQELCDVAQSVGGQDAYENEHGVGKREYVAPLFDSAIADAHAGRKLNDESAKDVDARRAYELACMLFLKLK